MIGVFVLAVLGRNRLDVFDNPADVTSSLQVAGPLVLLGWLVVIAAFGGYRDDVFGAGTDEYKRVFNASLVDRRAARRRLLPGEVPALPRLLPARLRPRRPGPAVGRWLLRQAVHRARRQGKLQYRVLIAGSPEHVDEIAAVLQRESWLGYHVAGALVPAARPARGDRRRDPGHRRLRAGDLA